MKSLIDGDSTMSMSIVSVTGPVPSVSELMLGFLFFLGELLKERIFWLSLLRLEIPFRSVGQLIPVGLTVS